MTYLYHYDSPIGPLTLASNGAAITGLWMDGQKYDRATLKGEVREDAAPAVFAAAARWLDDYFAGKAPAVDLPLAPAGSAFRQAVWKKLLAIPMGSVTTYGAIAKELTAETGRRAGAQAVGGAVGHNPISVIIPCHRVVGSTGSLTGYAGGVEKKAFLLRLEGVLPDKP